MIWKKTQSPWEKMTAAKKIDKRRLCSLDLRRDPTDVGKHLASLIGLASLSGVFYRAADEEIVAANKQAPPIRLPSRLLAHMRRWHRKGARYVVEFQGRPADPKRAFRNLTDDVLGEEAQGIVRHTMRHTAATWLMQGGVDMWQAAGYLGMTKETLEKTYGHHHPDHRGDVGNAFTSGRAGRIRQ
jgi:integrase